MNICISGVTSSIGYALAKKLASDGHTVWGIGRNIEKMEVLKEIYPPNRFFYSVMDITSPDQVVLTQKKMLSEGFFPDTIILLAAIIKDDIEDTFTDRHCREVMDVNFFGALSIVNTFLPTFINNNNGRFIALSSTTVARPTNNSLSYSTSKSALSNAFKSFNVHLKKNGLLFSTVYIGPVFSPMFKHRGFLVKTPEEVATKIFNEVLFSNKEVYFIPRIISILFIVPTFIGDKFFVYLSRLLKK